MEYAQAGQTTKRIREDWRAKVYRVKEEQDMNPEEWEMLRNAVLVRDNMTCQRCDERFRGKTYLTVHHIMPRSEGGSNDMTNLISLCAPCHDFVEIEGLDSKAAIIGSYDVPVPGVEMITKDDKRKVSDANRPGWHSFVYGSGKNPTK